MDKRVELANLISNDPSNYILAELPTSFGKSKIALEWLCNNTPSSASDFHILIVVPRLVLINNWKDEFIKWGHENYLDKVEFVTYVSFPKKQGKWDIVIFDEVHHLSERCREAINLNSINIVKAIMLSATVKKELKWYLKCKFPKLNIYKVGLREAVKENILPDPTVYLLPLYLNPTDKTQKIIKYPKNEKTIIVKYEERFKYVNMKQYKQIIPCTELQYYYDLNSLITFYKKRMAGNKLFKNRYLKACGDRLKWLSNLKTSYVKSLLSKFKNYRTLTFCNSIAQTEELGSHCINSSNKQSAEELQAFNTKKIKHITACNMLDEGINLADCRIGIYATLNSSERMIKQKLGRLLRHKKPIIIIPYYSNTREEEIVKTMCENYNPDLIKKIVDKKEILL